MVGKRRSRNPVFPSVVISWKRLARDNQGKSREPDEVQRLGPWADKREAAGLFRESQILVYGQDCSDECAGPTGTNSTATDTSENSRGSDNTALGHLHDIRLCHVSLWACQAPAPATVYRARCNSLGKSFCDLWTRNGDYRSQSLEEPAATAFKATTPGREREGRNRGCRGEAGANQRRG